MMSEHDLREGSKPEVNAKIQRIAERCKQRIILKRDMDYLLSQLAAILEENQRLRKELKESQDAHDAEGQAWIAMNEASGLKRDAAELCKVAYARLPGHGYTSFDALRSGGTKTMLLNFTKAILAELGETAADDKLAFEHANEIIGKYEESSKKAEAENQRLAKELERFKALEAHLPKGYAIGDDATAELAVKLGKMREALEALRVMEAFARSQGEKKNG